MQRVNYTTYNLPRTPNHRKTRSNTSNTQWIVWPRKQHQHPDNRQQHNHVRPHILDLFDPDWRPFRKLKGTEKNLSPRLNSLRTIFFRHLDPAAGGLRGRSFLQADSRPTSRPNPVANYHLPQRQASCEGLKCRKKLRPTIAASPGWALTPTAKPL